MRDNPNSGYLIEASELAGCLPFMQRRRVDELLADHDTDELQKLFEEHLPATLPRPEQTFLLGEEDAGDGLVSGEIYVEFAESDLYERIPKPSLNAFEKAVGQKPQYYQWTIWG